MGKKAVLRKIFVVSFLDKNQLDQHISIWEQEGRLWFIKLIWVYSGKNKV